MKHKFSIMAVILIAVTLFVTNINDKVALDVPLDNDKLAEELRELPNGSVIELRFWSINSAYHKSGEDKAMKNILAYGFYDRYGNRSLDSRIIQYFVTKYHAFGPYVDELIAMGYTDVDYSPVLSSTPSTPPAATTPTPAPTPTAFVVAPLDPPKTMWATQPVNYRDGADTTYNKVGQLKQHDQIVVVGIASTNWYQFSLDGGATYVYASNNYFTDVDPSNRSVIIDNPETGSYTAYEFSETNPSVIDKAIEQLEEEAEQKESELAKAETDVKKTDSEKPVTDEADETETESVVTIEEAPTGTEEVVETEKETVSESLEAETQTAQTLQTEEELPVTVEVTEEETEEVKESSEATAPITETVSQLSWTYIITAAILIGIMILGVVMVVKYMKYSKK